MPDALSQTTWAATLLLAGARVGGLFLVAPVFSTAVLPARLRAMVALVFALALAGGLDAAPVAANAWALAGMVACELAIGVTIGYAARVVLAGVQLGAAHVGSQMGLSLAEMYRGAGGQGAATLRRFMGLLAVVVFLAIGGHREVILALRRTFQAVPLAGFPAAEGMLAMVVALLAASFALALKIAAPVIVTLLLVTVALGLVQRTVPQLNTFTVGVPLRLMVGLLVLAVTLSVFAGLLEEALAAAMVQVDAWLGSV